MIELKRGCLPRLQSHLFSFAPEIEGLKCSEGNSKVSASERVYPFREISVLEVSSVLDRGIYTREVSILERCP